MLTHLSFISQFPWCSRASRRASFSTWSGLCWTGKEGRVSVQARRRRRRGGLKGPGGQSPALWGSWSWQWANWVSATTATRPFCCATAAANARPTGRTMTSPWSTWRGQGSRRRAARIRSATGPAAGLRRTKRNFLSWTTRAVTTRYRTCPQRTVAVYDPKRGTHPPPFPPVCCSKPLSERSALLKDNSWLLYLLKKWRKYWNIFLRLHHNNVFVTGRPHGQPALRLCSFQGNRKWLFITIKVLLCFDLCSNTVNCGVTTM